MSSNPKRLRVSSSQSPKPDTCTISEASNALDVVAVPLTSKSATSKDDNPGNSVFTHAILPVILDNLQTLTPEDLLRFRLVNRCWRDAATSVLLKRSACDIALKIGQVAPDGAANPTSHQQLLEVHPNFDRNEHTPPIYKLYSARPPYSLLPDLIQTISTSPEFPSNSIKFLPGCEMALKNLSLSLPQENYLLEEDELRRLLSLLGKNIKKLFIYNRILSNTVEKLLFLYMPNLVCLDFTKCFVFETRDRQQIQNQVFHLKKVRTKNVNSNLTLTKLERIIPGARATFHWTKEDFLETLINISPNIRAVQDVGIASLSILVKMRKAHLVKSALYNPASNYYCKILFDEAIKRDSGLPSLKLSQLTIKLTRMKSAYENVTTVLNIILQGSKDTLEYLELRVNPEDFLENIKIPPLKKLKCLKLIQEKEIFENSLSSRRKADEASGCGYERYVFQFENQRNPYRIPRDYFPALSKVLLDVDLASINTFNTLLAFFALEHTGSIGQCISSGDTIPSVTILELSTFPDLGMKLGKLFPNVSNLKIKCGPGSKLYNWVWEAFPKLETLGIFDFIPDMSTEAVDSFFSGIPGEVSSKLYANIKTIVRPDLTAEQILPYHRTQPYIGDCKNLKEFTIQFKENISSMFASKLTGLYAFQGIIQIVFSLDSVGLTEQEKEEIQKHLEPVALYNKICR